jgi:hypothetical protein
MHPIQGIETPYYSDINSLINAFGTASGFQKSNRFRVKITPPVGMSFQGGLPANFYVFASNVQVPTQSIIFYEDTMSPSGPPISIPLRRNYDDRYLVEFIVDKNWNIKDFFEQWYNYMFLGNNKSVIETNNAQSTWSSTYVKFWKDIVGKFRIDALDQNDNITKTIILHDAWPKQILPTQMSNDTPNQYLTVIVDIVYRYYTVTSP